jgi:hypothetical protein
MSFRRQQAVTSNKDCAAIDFKEGFVRNEITAVDELKSEIQALKEKLNTPMPAPVVTNKPAFHPSSKEPYHNKQHVKRHHKLHPNQCMEEENIELTKLQTNVMNKIAHLETKYKEKKKNDDILMKLANIEEKLQLDKNVCPHTENLKMQVFDKINSLESKIELSKSTEFKTNESCKTDEDELKTQVFEKLARLENHMRLKSEVPVVNRDILRAEEQKLAKLIEMRSKYDNKM